MKKGAEPCLKKQVNDAFDLGAHRGFPNGIDMLKSFGIIWEFHCCTRSFYCGWNRRRVSGCGFVWVGGFWRWWSRCNTGKRWLALLLLLLKLIEAFLQCHLENWRQYSQLSEPKYKFLCIKNCEDDYSSVLIWQQEEVSWYHKYNKCMLKPYK